MIGGRAVFVPLMVALVYWAPQWMPHGAEKRATESRATTARNVDADSILREGRVNRESAPLTSEQRQMFEELDSARADVIRAQGDRARIAQAKVRDKLLQSIDQDTKKSTLSFYEWAADVWQSAEVTYDKFRPRAESWMWSIAIIMVLVGIAAAFAAQTRVARATARFGVGVARAWLVIVSFLLMAIAIATHVNPWAFVPHELVFAPLAALAGCALAMRLVDFNYPVWNSVVRGCGAPVISMGFTAVFLKLV